MCQIIEQVIDGTLRREAAADKLGVSIRTIQRRCNQYLFAGASSFAHRLRGHSPHNKYLDSLSNLVVDLYEQLYKGYNFTHFWQKLTEKEGIDISYPSVYRILDNAGYSSPQARRLRKKDMHPSRQRRLGFGELLQMDASKHIWFGEHYCYLHASIDDATSQVTGAYFEKEETLQGYFQVLAQVLFDYGIPEELYTDRRTIFSSIKTQEARLDKDTSTQFRVAAAKLGITSIHLTSVPQAKGRIERLFSTFQDRLVAEMRSASITSIREANAFLPAFIAAHNKRYALSSTNLHQAFGPKMKQADINIALSVVDSRLMTPGGTISYKGNHYIPFSARKRIILPPKTRVVVLKSLDQKLYAVHGDEIWVLLRQKDYSLPTPDDIKGKIYIPPRNHPWKEESYLTVLKKYRRAS